MTSLRSAHWLALLLPAGLIGGALISQFWFGLFPCEMCHWQRWPHYAAMLIALLAFAVPVNRGRAVFVALAALAIATSGAIGVFHAGVEYGWWAGLTSCSAPGSGSLEDIFNAPLTRCDVAPWTMLGISLAGFNAILSLAGAGLILTLLRRSQVTGR